MRIAGIATAFTVCLSVAVGEDAKREGAEMLGRPMPDWAGLKWLTDAGKAPEIGGKVVLVRWWTDGCGLCSATAPVLNELYEKHAKDGLVVVGVYHPKPRPRAVADERVTRAAAELGFAFPVAVDADWTVLKRWWLAGGDRRFTSISFLIGRAGKVCWVHPGGEYHASRDSAHAECDADYRSLSAAVAEAVRSRK